MRTAFRWWRPGFAMLALLSTLGLAGASMADTTGLLRGKHIIFVEPYGPGSATNLPVALLQAELASKTGASIEVRSVGGRAGGTTLDYLINPPAAVKGSLVFGVLDVTGRLLAEMAGGRPRLLERVQPVALLSTGASAALIVSDKSPIKSIDDFLNQAHKKQLRLVHLGRKAAFGIELAMLEKSFGLRFADKVVSTRAQILAALASGEADAGFLVTYTLLPSPAAPAPPVRPILTFGAEPNPDFVVPTLKQRARDPKLDLVGERLGDAQLGVAAGAQVGVALQRAVIDRRVRRRAGVDHAVLLVAIDLRQRKHRRPRHRRGVG